MTLSTLSASMSSGPLPVFIDQIKLELNALFNLKVYILSLGKYNFSSVICFPNIRVRKTQSREYCHNYYATRLTNQRFQYQGYYHLEEILYLATAALSLTFILPACCCLYCCFAFTFQLLHLPLHYFTAAAEDIL